MAKIAAVAVAMAKIAAVAVAMAKIATITKATAAVIVNCQKPKLISTYLTF